VIQPIRPQDATGIYQRQAVQGAESEPGVRTGRAAGEAHGGRRSDRVTISSQAQELHQVMSAVRDAPDVRAERVARLHAQVAAGQYRVDPEAVARRLVEDGIAT
jgi:flagellar biosynthesis anti-sigma factor FlgM